MGYAGGYTAVTDFLCEVRPPPQSRFERRFETPPGRQAQIDLAEFAVEFTDEPGVIRKVSYIGTSGEFRIGVDTAQRGGGPATW
jgi:transposase